jgi:acetyl esterase/lipase
MMAGTRLLPLLALPVLLLASLTVVTPFTNALWKLSIPVKEGGHFLALPALGLGLWMIFKRAIAIRLTGAMILASGLLFASPLARAFLAAESLEARFTEAFPAASGLPTDRLSRGTPLALGDLFFGIRSPKTPARAMVYSTHPAAPRHPGELHLDFHPASGRASAPCVVILHGGGWDGGNRKQMPEINHWLSSRGYAVASLDYRRAPEFRFPAPVEDTRAALAYLRSKAGELGIDSTRFILLGRSAGGQIALQAAYGLRDSTIRAVVSFYAPADMVMGYGLPVNPWIMDSRKLMENYLGGTLSAVPENFRASSPVETVDSSRSVPTLLLHGRPDVLVAYEHTRRLEARLAGLGEKHFIVDLPWAAHGYDYLFSGPGSQIGLYFLERFLALQG